MIHIEEYKEAGSYDEEGDSLGIVPCSGAAFGVCAVSVGGQSTTRCGGAPAYAPLAWGSCEAAEYAAVTGWEVVTDLDAAGGEQIPGRLLVAYWQGRIWLRLTQDNEAPSAGDTGDEECCGAGYVGCAGKDGLPQDAPGRAVLPQLYICPMEQRERFLRAADGRWRGDVCWEVLANYIYHPEPGEYQVDPDDPERYTWKNAYRVTIWAVPCGNVLCFYTTRSWFFDENDLHLAGPYAARMKWSAWGMPYEVDGEESREKLEEEGGPFAPFWAAALPWEEEGSEPAVEEDEVQVQAAPGLQGTENYLGRVGRSPGLPSPPAMAVPVSLCGRFHNGRMFGTSWRGVHWTVAPTVQEATGYETWGDAVRGYLVDAAEDITPGFGDGPCETAQDYRFDPASIEGRGVSIGYNVGWYTPGEDVWPAVAPPYELLAAATLTSPYGPLYVAIAGTTADGVLLTASNFAEPLAGMDDPENQGAGTGREPWPESGLDPLPSPDPDPPEPEPVPGTVDPPEPDDDDTGGDDGILTPEDGYYFTAGNHIAIHATRTNVQNAAGNVVTIQFGFDIDVTAEDLFWSAGTRYLAEVRMSTSNGGSYSYNGTACTMFYGFTASSYEGTSATLQWRSSYMYGDTDPKSCTVRTYVAGSVTVAAQFPQSGWADSESLPQSNILSFKNTGRRKLYSVNGVKRYFKIYTVALKKGVLKGIALRRAMKATPTITVSPASASGNNSGEPSGGPVVSVDAGSVTTAHTNDYSTSPAGVTGCLPATFAADFEAGAGGVVAVRGNSSWHYDPDNAAGSGSIDAEFTVSLQDQSIEL